MPEDVTSLREFLAWGQRWHIFESWVGEDPVVAQIGTRARSVDGAEVVFLEAEFDELVRAMTRPNQPSPSVGIQIWEDIAGVMLERIGMNGHGSKHFVLKDCKFVHDEVYGPFRPPEILLPPLVPGTKRYFQGLFSPSGSD
jgi:hypothetical protein